MSSVFVGFATALTLFTAAAQSLGADLQQESFEAYAAGLWSPPAIWKLGPRGGNTTNAGLVSAEILAANGLAGNYLRMVASGWNGKATWAVALDKQKAPRQVVEATFRLVERVAHDAQARWSASIWIGPDYWDAVASLEFKESAGSASAALSTAEITPIPGGTDWTMGNWLTVQVELDYVAGMVRARFGPAGGGFNEWTKALFMKQTVQYQGIDFGCNGTIDMDTLVIQPGAVP